MKIRNSKRKKMNIKKRILMHLMNLVDIKDKKIMNSPFIKKIYLNKDVYNNNKMIQNINKNKMNWNYKNCNKKKNTKDNNLNNNKWNMNKN